MCLTDKPEISLYAKVSSDPPSAVKRSTATNCCTFVFGVRTPAAGWAPGSASSRTYKKSLISRTLLQPGPPKRRVTQPISSGSISCHRLRTSHCPVTRQNGDLPSGEADGGGGEHSKGLESVQKWSHGSPSQSSNSPVCPGKGTSKDDSA